MHKMFAQFFWSKSVGGKSRHWTSWDTLCQPCEEGEVGFRSIHDVSKALFCKLFGETLELNLPYGVISLVRNIARN